MLATKAYLLAGGVALACIASAGAGYTVAASRASASASVACVAAPAAGSAQAMPPWGGPATLPAGKSW
jgi:hypothetical protein